MTIDVEKAIDLLNAHYMAFVNAKPFADATGHPIPSDTRAWSQILVSILTGIPGLKRKKGADLADGSDVKGANVWAAIDTPRFNGVVPAGRILTASESADDLYPNIYFVMWDHKGDKERCRVWCVRPAEDPIFKAIANLWYTKRKNGEIRSSNFQLHPPRNRDDNVFRNTCGNLEYPLLFEAIRENGSFKLTHFTPEIIETGRCKLIK